MPRKGIPGSYGNSMFNVLRNRLTVFFHSSYTILHLYQPDLSLIPTEMGDRFLVCYLQDLAQRAASKDNLFLKISGFVNKALLNIDHIQSTSLQKQSLFECFPPGMDKWMNINKVSTCFVTLTDSCLSWQPLGPNKER